MARLDISNREIAERGAHGGSVDALFQLGMMHCAGRDAEYDLVNAHKWFNLAALRGNGAAKRYRMEIASEMSKIEIARAQKLARQWLSTR